MRPSARALPQSGVLQMARLCLNLVAMTLPLSSSLAAQGDEPLEYNRDVRPILAEYCFACHGADSASRKADLRLDERAAAMESGAITPQDPDGSELVARIESHDDDLRMPPPETQKKLTEVQIAVLKQWIADGAEYQPHWSLLAPHKTQPPAVKLADWPKNEIDRFVLAKLEQNNLSPAPAAEPRTLFRRVHLDLTGLPPAPKDLDAFEREYSAGHDGPEQDAVLSRWIDRLMNSTAWGEHRARYWLDAARYADTHGLHFDNYREMWPYRDWVIRAFNENLPFDQFTVAQLAGDLLPQPTPDQLIATGFQRCNMTTNEGGTIDEENLANYASDRVQTFGWVYLGLTTNCAQCHDHKFDPILMKDYYSLAAFFRNTTQPAKDGNVKDGRGAVVTVPANEDRLRWEALPQEIDAASARRDARRQAARAEFEAWRLEATPESLEAQLPQDSLVVHVPLTEGSGNQVHGVGPLPETFQATGDVAWQVEGKLGPAAVMKLGSTFELGQLGDFERNQGFSYAAWLKAGSRDVNGGIIAKLDELAAYRGWDLFQSGSRFAVHLVDSWPGNALKVSTRREVVDPKQWQHVLVSYDGSGKAAGIKVYLNGISEPLNVDSDTLTADASIDTPTPLRIGQRGGTQVFEGGVIQDVRLYTRQLTEAEALAMAQVTPLAQLLTIPAAELSESQQERLYDYYLKTYDQQFTSLSQQVAELQSERDAIRQRSPVTHVQQEKPSSPAMANLLMRGEYDRVGEPVAAGTPAALHPFSQELPKNRLGLAKWVVDRANPLTARVTVNRFWGQVFGQGIVPTSEDFGVMGMLPSHPELLDWLAIDFQDSGWDVKRFFKQMLMSATYRQAGLTTEEKLQRDPGNALLSRGPRFRMDAEMVRDYALSCSGLLSTTMFGPGVKPYQPEKIWDMVGLPEGNTREYVADHGENLYRRSLYAFWKRMAPPPNLEAFNAPSREVCTVRRERTNTPLQALVTLNDPQFVEAARNLAQLALHASAENLSAEDDVAVANGIAQRVLGRPWSDSERAIVLRSHCEYLQYYRGHTQDAQAIAQVGESPSDDQLDVAELAAWTMVCNQVLNLDEVLCK